MTAVLSPLFIQVAMTLVLVVVLGVLRVAEALRDSDVKTGASAGRTDIYSRTPSLISDNFKNQFELPVLFYGAVILAVATGPVPDSFVTLAWVFAISRIVHTLIHCTVNVVALRFLAFGVGLIAVALMWFDLYHRLLAG